MTKCVNPLRHLERLSAKSSRSTNQNAPFGRLSTTCCLVSKWFHALCHTGPYTVDALAARVVFYYSLAHERFGTLAEVRAPLLAGAYTRPLLSST